MDLSDVQLPTNKRLVSFLLAYIGNVYCTQNPMMLLHTDLVRFVNAFIFNFGYSGKVNASQHSLIKLGLLIGRIVSPLVLGLFSFSFLHLLLLFQGYWAEMS